MTTLTLEKDILFLAKCDHDIHRVQMASGTTSIELCSKDKQDKYRKRAFIPRDDWSDPSASVLNHIVCESVLEDNHCQYISVDKLPDEYLRPLIDFIDYNDDTTSKQIDHLKASPEFQASLRQAMTYFAQFVCPSRYEKNPYFEISLFVNRIDSSINTGTRDRYQGNKLVGLHVDNWDELPIGNRHESTNRMCLNLGSAPRYLYFLNISVKRMKRALDSLHDSTIPPTFNAFECYHLFMEKFPDYPVFKIKIEPGEFYLAPTEDFIHDATFEADMDITFTIRSFFNIGT